MNPLTHKICWPGWKFGVLKFSMVVFGILMGTLFPEFFRPWTAGLWIAFGVLAAMSTVWGLQAMREREGKAGIS